MRITRNLLLKYAQNTVAERLVKDRQIISAILTGSLLGEDYLLGGTADIDIVFICDNVSPISREIVKISSEIHLDISCLSRREFINTRQLRSEAWLGSIICKDPLVLHDRNHWFDYIQASVCSKFMQPDNILLRAHPLLELARQTWFKLNENQSAFTPAMLSSYFSALEYSSNAVALLTGSPLTERRFLMQFPARAEAVGRSNLFYALKDLFIEQVPDVELWQMWLLSWRGFFKAASALPQCSLKYHPCRMAYYEHAADAMFSSHPVAAIWLLMKTWSQTAALIQETAELQQWQEACRFLGLSASNMGSRLYDLDVYIDMVEETLEKWAGSFGIHP